MNAIQTDLRVTSLEEVQEAVRSTPALQIAGGRTKPALSTPAQDVPVLGMTGLSGILEYDPGEYTFTALAGTRLSTVHDALAEHGQYLPFDPPLVVARATLGDTVAGATLGGTVAAGLSGSGRQRYGGVRDFLLGIRFVDGQGRLVRGGGKVVKNAAGFDLPKLFTGSLGQLGVLVEVSFKVFPQPSAYATLAIEQDTLATALDGLAALTKTSSASFDIDALDIAMDGGEDGDDNSVTTLVRIGGLAETLDARLNGLAALLGEGERYIGETEKNLWRETRDFAWKPTDATLVKVPISPTKLAAFDAEIDAEIDTEIDTALPDRYIMRRYTVGGNLAWLAWADPLTDLHGLLSVQGLPGLVLTGQTDTPIIGAWSGGALYRRIKRTLDPKGRFPDYLK